MNLRRQCKNREGEISLLEEEWEKEKGERDGQNCNI